MNAQLKVSILSANQYASIRDAIVENSDRQVGQVYYPEYSFFKTDLQLGVTPQQDMLTGEITYGETGAPAINLTGPQAPAGTSLAADDNQLAFNFEGALKSGGLTDTTGNALLSLDTLQGVGKTLGIVGLGALVYDGFSTAEAAETDASTGNYSGAVQLYNDFAARTALMFGGAIAAAEIGGVLCAPAGLGALACAGLGLVGGALGALGGSAAYKATGPNAIGQIENAFGNLFKSVDTSVLTNLPAAAAPGVTTTALGTTSKTLTDPNAGYILNATTGQLTSIDEAGIANSGLVTIDNASGNYIGSIAQGDVTGITENNGQFQITGKLGTATAWLNYNPTSNTWNYNINGVGQAGIIGQSDLTITNNADGTFSVGNVLDSPVGTTLSVKNNYTSAGTLSSRLTDNTSGTSTLLAFNPGAGVTSLTSTYSGADATGTVLQQVQNNTSGTSIVVLNNPSSMIASSTTEYSGSNGTGIVEYTSVVSTNGTVVDEAFGMTPGDINMTWNYNSARAITSAVETETNGDQATYTYNSQGFVGSIYTTGTGFTQNDVFSAPGVQCNEYFVNTTNGATYNSTYATSVAGDPLQQSVNSAPGYGTTTCDYATGLNGDPVGAETLQLASGETINYGYATQVAGDPASKIIITTPGVSTVEDDFENTSASNTIVQQHVANQNGTQIWTAYDTTGGNWTTAVAFYNAAGTETELNTQYTNNTEVNQYMNGQAQGWNTQVFDYSAGLLTQNSINYTNGVSYTNTYLGTGLTAYKITNANGSSSVTVLNYTGTQPWNSYTSEYNAAGAGIGSVAAYNGYSIVNGNQAVLGNNVDVPGDVVNVAGQIDSDPFAAGSSDPVGSDGGTGTDTNDGPNNPGLSITVTPGGTEGVPQALNGAGENSSPSGHAGTANTLSSGKAATTLTGSGDTTYLIQGTAAAQTIVNSATSGPQASGEVKFADGATAEDLWFSALGNNLLVDVLGTKEQVTIQNWFTSPAAQVQEFVSADSLKLDTQLSQLIQVMATYSAGHGGFNPQTAGTIMPADTTLQTEIAAAWHK